MAAPHLDTEQSPSAILDAARFYASSLQGQRARVGNRQTAEERAAARALRTLRTIIAAAIKRFVQALEFELQIPGQHYGGISNQDLYEILASQGRDFGADSRSLDRHIRVALLTEFEDADAIPLLLEFKETAADAILEWIVARWENRIRDVRIAANDQLYLKRKVAAGGDSRPGVRTGDLLNAVRDRGRVKVTT